MGQISTKRQEVIEMSYRRGDIFPACASDMSGKRRRNCWLNWKWLTYLSNCGNAVD